MIDNSKRLEHISEYYFSKKLREVKSLIDKGEDIVNLGIGSQIYCHLKIQLIQL